MNYKYHYVYRISNILTTMHYYGSRSCNCHPSEDIGIKYFSTSTIKSFKIDQKENPQNYKYKLIKIFETSRTEAVLLEVRLHSKFDVKNHPKFINKANQKTAGFDTTGRVFPKEEKQRRSKIMKKVFDNNPEIMKAQSNRMKGKGNHFYGKSHTSETLKKISVTSKERISNGHKPSAITIKIYDNLGKLIHSINGCFIPFCKENKLPLQAFQDSYRNNSKKIYQTNQGIINAKRCNFEKYIGWYAVKVSKN